MGKEFRNYCATCGKKGYLSFGTPRKTPWFCNECKCIELRRRERVRASDSRIKKRLIKSRGSVCEVCQKQSRVVMHHIKRVADGGTSVAENLLLVCNKCHYNIHNGKRS